MLIFKCTLPETSNKKAPENRPFKYPKRARMVGKVSGSPPFSQISTVKTEDLEIRWANELEGSQPLGVVGTFTRKKSCCHLGRGKIKVQFLEDSPMKFDDKMYFPYDFNDLFK